MLPNPTPPRSDVVSFTDISSNSNPRDVLTMLHTYFTSLDDFVKSVGAYKARNRCLDGMAGWPMVQLCCGFDCEQSHGAAVRMAYATLAPAV